MSTTFPISSSDPDRLGVPGTSAQPITRAGRSPFAAVPVLDRTADRGADRADRAARTDRPALRAVAERRRCCLLLADRAPTEVAVRRLLDGRNPRAWRFQVVVTARPEPWPYSVAAADPMSGWMLLPELDDEPERREGVRRDALDGWLRELHSFGFRALGTSSSDGCWSAALDHLDDRRFDEVILCNDTHGATGAFARLADRFLTWRLRHRYRIPASSLAV